MGEKGHFQFFRTPTLIPYTLKSQVIAQHYPKNKIFFACQLIKLEAGKAPKYLQALRGPEKDINFSASYSIDTKGNPLSIKIMLNTVLIINITGIQNQRPDPFLNFVGQMPENIHIDPP